MKQTKKIETFEQLHANEMALVKGGFSSNDQQDIYVYIDGIRYKITAKGLEPA